MQVQPTKTAPKILLSARNVRLIYPIYTIQASSLRNTMLNLATGGRVLRDAGNVVHVQALDGVSFDLYEGDRLGLYGHNGSGKTTMLKVLAGIYEPTQGQIVAHGRVSSMIEMGHGMDPEATGIENIKIMGRYRGFNGREIKAKIEEITEFADLGPFINLPVRTYSAGMTMRLLFATGTCFDPDILILDEWLGAGDASFMEKAKQRMDTFVDRSRMLVLASHSQDLLTRVCNKLCVLEAGRMVYFGDPKEYFEKNA